MSTSLLPGPSTSALEAFHRDGFHIARACFSPDEVAALSDAAMAQVERGPVAGLYDDYHQTGAADPLRRHPRMLMPHLQRELEIGRLAERALFAPRLRSQLQALLGEEPCAAQSMLYFKPPGARGQDLHQDDFYLRSAPGCCLAAWVALDHVDEENGGLRLVAGSQHLPLLPTRQADLTTYFADDAVDMPLGLEVVAPVLAPGDVLIFGGRVIHGSGPNRSADRFRRSFICHYVGANTTHLNPWNRPVETFDRRAIPVAESLIGPWQDSFAGRRQSSRPH